MHTGAYKSGGHFPDEQPKGWKGKKSKPPSLTRISLRDYAYDFLLEGGTRRQICVKLQEVYPQASWDQCLQAFEDAGQYLKKEQEETREILLDVLQAHRLSAISKGLKKGQLMAVSTLLRDAGAVIGEAEREQQSQSVELKLSVSPPPAPFPGPSDAEVIDITDNENHSQQADTEEPPPALPETVTRVQTDLFGQDGPVN